MAGSPITGYVTPGITLGTNGYYSPLTVTNSGTVNSGASPSAIFGPSTSASTVANYGTIAATGGAGSVTINLAGGGLLNNGPSGLIEGYFGAEVSGGTVTNAGTIIGTGAGPEPNLLALYGNGYGGGFYGGGFAVFL